MTCFEDTVMWKCAPPPTRISAGPCDEVSSTSNTWGGQGEPGLAATFPTERRNSCSAVQMILLTFQDIS